MKLSLVNLFTLLLGSFVVSYIGISFVEATFDFTTWDEKVRGLAIYVTVGLTTTALLLVDNEKVVIKTKDEKEEFPNSVIFSADGE